MNARQRHIPTQPQSVPGARAPDLTVDELAALKRVHPSQIVRLVAQGLPCVDLAAVRSPGKRAKRLLRFNLEAVERWLAARGGAA